MPAPNSEALAELRKLVAALGGANLPVPSGFAACDDCNQSTAIYPYGRVEVCVRCWRRRDRCAALSIKYEL